MSGDATPEPEQIWQVLQHTQAKLSATAIAVTLLFEELATADADAARRAIARLRETAVVPMQPTVAQAIEKLVSMWQDTLDGLSAERAGGSPAAPRI